MSETTGERQTSACRYKREVPEGSRPMAFDLRHLLTQCRLLLRKSRITFAERKTTNEKGLATITRGKPFEGI